MKKILIDTTFLFDQFSKRGLGFYGRNLLIRLIQNMVKSNEVYLGLIGFKTLNANLAEIGFTNLEIQELSKLSNNIEFFSLGRPSIANLSILQTKLVYQRAIEKFQPDLFFTLSTKRMLPNKYIKSAKKNMKILINLLDFYSIEELKIPRSLNPLTRLKYKLNFKKILNTDLIIVSTISAKEELQKMSKSSLNISVIAPGVDQKYFFEKQVLTDEKIRSMKKFYGIADNYFIFNNSLEDDIARKYLVTFLKALKQQQNLRIPHQVVIVGRDLHKGIGRSIKSNTIHGEKFLSLVKKHNLLDILVATDRIPDEHLLTILSYADACLTFSNSQKFNLVKLQAMASKVPIITSEGNKEDDITQGNAIAYINLESLKAKNNQKYSEELFTNISNSINLTSGRSEKIIEGFNIAKRYNWDATAGLTWDMIKQQLQIKDSKVLD